MAVDWGFFDSFGDRHIAPCTPDGVITDRHLISMVCPCGPIRDNVQTSLVVHIDADV
jgi:hypothetical protein